MKTKIKITYNIELNYDDLLELEGLLLTIDENQPLDEFDNQTLENILTKVHNGIEDIEKAAKGLNRGWLNG